MVPSTYLYLLLSSMVFASVSPCMSRGRFTVYSIEVTVPGRVLPPAVVMFGTTLVLTTSGFSGSKMRSCGGVKRDEDDGMPGLSALC